MPAELMLAVTMCHSLSLYDLPLAIVRLLPSWARTPKTSLPLLLM